MTNNIYVFRRKINFFSFNLDAVESNAQKRRQNDKVLRTIKGAGVGVVCGVAVFGLMAMTPLVVASVVGTGVSALCGAAIVAGTS